jgi:exopolysaccharide biosynthesis polyprenyl glycosylphosphotransferase
MTPVRTLILGTGLLAQEILKEIKQQNRSDSVIAGIVSEIPVEQTQLAGSPLLGSLKDLPGIIEDAEPDLFVAAMSKQREHLVIQRLIEARIQRGIRIESGERLYERITGKVPMEALMPSNLMFSTAFELPRMELAMARAMSFTMALAGLLVLLPLFLQIALAIKLDSRGPVLFVQERAGLGGRPFRLLKFRSMRIEDRSISEWANDNTHRITRVGKWLRKFRLDELPQFINVLRGDMNIVGPRPHPVSNLELFILVSRNMSENGQIPYYAIRSLVRPGITGWAQVRYQYANNLNEEIEKMRFDLYYVKYFSILLDIRIILETIRTVALGREQPENRMPDAQAARAPQVPLMHKR